MKEESIEELIYSETEKRLAEMEDPKYEFPAQIGTLDWILIAAGVVISIALIAGCIMGVIV